MQQTTHVLADRYELGPVLGEGGMARVHRGYDRHLRRPVAVKVLAPPYDRDRTFVERFRREARSAAGLSHPNVVSVFDSGSYHGTHFIVTELVEGETLGERLRRGPMPPREAAAVAIDVCHALEAAHARGLIHRDVKPGNVMLLPDGRVKVLDFGIAHAAGSDTLTGTGAVLGSTAYLAPEQASAQPVDERADLYALGCVLYEMLAGSAPFRADTPVATMYRHVNEDPPPPSRIRPVPAGLEAVVMRCLEKDPRRRYGSALELEHALATAGEDTAPLEVAPAAETRPIAVVGAPPSTPTPGGAAAPASTMPGASPGGPTRGPTGRPASRRSIGARGRLLAALAVGLVLVLSGVVIAANRDQLPTRAQIRQASSSGGGKPTTMTSPSPEPFSTALSSLMEAIGSARASGDIDEDAARELTKRATELANAYREGDPEKVGESVARLGDAFNHAVDEGKITPSATDAIDRAISGVVVALQAEGALGTVSPAPTSGEGHEDSSGPGPGSEDHGNGPPDHAEANGHGEG
ncbi:MAG TPA: protein kinase [Actinomycetota bacterium]|nr:protein kinase [Actinomycetota bacterium]